MAARLFRIVWLAVLLGHVMVAVLWWWLQPGGFPVSHPRFWSNRVAPVGVLALATFALWALHRERTDLLRVLLPIWPAAWSAMAVAGRYLFPISLAWGWLVPLLASVVMAVVAFPRRAQQPLGDAQRTRALLATAMTVSALAGAGMVLTQYVPAGSTHPLDIRFPELDSASSRPFVQPGAIRLAGNAMVQASDGSITVPISGLTLMVEPILTFSSRSPDGCPTVLVGPFERAGPVPRFRAGCRDGERACSLFYELAAQGPAFLAARAGPGGQALSVMTVTQLDHPVYSHLNSFCDFEIRGHRRLSLEFSPCPGIPIEVRRFDYPIGRPARFAYLDRQGAFRVVEASSGEKGPYRALVSGALGRDEPLSITLIDQGRPKARITLADWAGQADTSLSPTAGWGVPVNAIEFSLSDDGPESPASIFVTLAGTSVGRGWDCVGHAAGTYRNRILFETVDQSRKPTVSASEPAASSDRAPARD
jgi:hypothetical protein